MSIKAVTFDFDGTLYPYYRLFLKSIYLGLIHPGFFIAFGRVRSEIRKMRPINDFHKTQAELLSERLAIPYQKARQLIEYHIYQNLKLKFKGIKAFPYLKDNLDGLKKEGFKLAVLSDFPVDSKINYLGMGGFWDCTFCSEQCNYLKPNPEPFLKIADLLVLPPHKILYIGDRYDYDIIGAHHVGMKTGHLSRTAESGGVADFTFYGYKNLRNLIIRYDNC